jgi:hypothetical protein
MAARLRWVAHPLIGPGHVLRVAREIFRPIGAVRSLGDISKERDPERSVGIAAGKIRFERNGRGRNAGLSHDGAHILIGAHGGRLVGTARRRLDDETRSAARAVLLKEAVKLPLLHLQ